MKKLVIGFCLGLFISACASKVIIPSLENRTLTIHESGKLAYPSCTKRSIFGKCKEWTYEFYDITDPIVRVRLRDFRCVNKMRKF